MERDEQFKANLSSALDFIRDLIDDPDRLDMIVDREVVVLLPTSDPELRDANEGLVRQQNATALDYDPRESRWERQERERARDETRAEPAEPKPAYA